MGLAAIRLSEEERRRAGTALQWTIGIGTGVLYGAIRDRLPGSGIRRGLLYGAAVSLLFDEGLLPLLGFAPGPLAFPWQAHGRGFLGHLAYGAVVDIAMTGLDGIGEPRRHGGANREALPGPTAVDHSSGGCRCDTDIAS